jgi:hypothetical protein
MNLEIVALIFKNQKKTKLGEKIESKSNKTLWNIIHYLNMNLKLAALMFKISERDKIRRENWIQEQIDAEVERPRNRRTN